MFLYRRIYIYTAHSYNNIQECTSPILNAIEKAGVYAEVFPGKSHVTQYKTNQTSKQHMDFFFNLLQKFIIQQIRHSLFTFIKTSMTTNTISTMNLVIIITRFGSRIFGRSTFWETCTSVVNHEDMDSIFPFLTKWEAHIIQVNFFLVQQNKRNI